MNVTIAANRTVAPPRLRLSAFWLLAALWLIDLAWSSALGLHLAGLDDVAASLLLLAINLAFYRRYETDGRLAAMVSGFATFFAFMLGFVILSYLAATLNRPYVDPALARMDAALGFDWMAWWRFVAHRPLFGALLRASYRTMVPQIFLNLIVLPLCGDAARSRRLLTCLGIGMACTLAAFMFLPAQCALVYYNPDPAKTYGYAVDLAALRAGSIPILDLRSYQGLVTFPSFHTFAAVLLVHTARGTRFFFLSCVVNMLMITATLTVGGHYLVDLIAGAALACATIVAVPLTNSRCPQPSAVRP